jgi:hypothetical protein
LGSGTSAAKQSRGNFESALLFSYGWSISHKEKHERKDSPQCT